MRVLLFDIGNVLIKADHGITLRKLAEYGVPEERAGGFFTNEGYKDFGRGRISGKEFYADLVGKYLRHPLTYGQVVQAHDAHMYAVDAGVMQLLDSLKNCSSASKMAFWTDTNEWQTRREKELIDVSKYGPAIRSDELRLLKRDADVFQRVLDVLEAEPEEVTLVDDSPEVCELAESNGLNAHVFKDSDGLERFLKSERHL